MKFTTLAHITTAASIYMVSSIVVAHTHHHGGITTQPSKVVKASFDIVHSKIDLTPEKRIP